MVTEVGVMPLALAVLDPPEAALVAVEPPDAVVVGVELPLDELPQPAATNMASVATPSDCSTLRERIFIRISPQSSLVHPVRAEIVGLQGVPMCNRARRHRSAWLVSTPFHVVWGQI